MASKKKRILFIERQESTSVSIERVFAEVAGGLDPEKYSIDFQKLENGNGLVGIIRNLLSFRPNDADIFHITGHIHYLALILPSKKTVLTIHDLVFLHNRKGIRRAVLKKLFLDLPLKRLKYLTAISSATQKEIALHSDIEEKKIRVIDNPLIGQFEPIPEKPFNHDVPLILQIGTTDNKNISNLGKALAGLSCRLRIIGTLNDRIINELNELSIDHESVSHVSNEQIAEEYRNADIVSFCSTYEGFGLPIIEGQAMRKPVLTSDMAPMNYVAGNGAALVDPFDVESIRNGIERIIQDQHFRSEIVELGYINSKRFAPNEIAMQYARVYEEMLTE